MGREKRDGEGKERREKRRGGKRDEGKDMRREKRCGGERDEEGKEMWGKRM